MVANWLQSVGVPLSAALVLMFGFGMACGWLIWGGARGARPGDEEAARDAAEAEETEKAAGALAEILRGEPGADDPCPPEMKIGALESEIRTARELIEKEDGETREFAERIETLDAAIKRANGRLKLILRAVRKEGR